MGSVETAADSLTFEVTLGAECRTYGARRIFASWTQGLPFDFAQGRLPRLTCNASPALAGPSAQGFFANPCDSRKEVKKSRQLPGGDERHCWRSVLAAVAQVRVGAAVGGTARFEHLQPFSDLFAQRTDVNAAKVVRVALQAQTRPVQQ